MNQLNESVLKKIIFLNYPRRKASCTDYSKPLAIPWGTDTLASINLSRDVKTLNPETIKQIYGSRIPQDAPEEKTNFEDPSSDPNFAEPIIDRLRGQREQVKETAKFFLKKMFIFYKICFKEAFFPCVVDVRFIIVSKIS